MSQIMESPPDIGAVAVKVAGRMVGCSDSAQGGQVWVDGGSLGCLVILQSEAGKSEERRRLLVAKLAAAITAVLEAEVSG